jgi:hypothetical protein
MDTSAEGKHRSSELPDVHGMRMLGVHCMRRAGKQSSRGKQDMQQRQTQLAWLAGLPGRHSSSWAAPLPHSGTMNCNCIPTLHNRTPPPPPSLQHPCNPCCFPGPPSPPRACLSHVTAGLQPTHPPRLSIPAGLPPPTLSLFSRALPTHSPSV